MSAIPAPDERAAGYAGTMPRTAEGGSLGLALVVIASAQPEGGVGVAGARLRWPLQGREPLHQDLAARSRRSASGLISKR